MLASGGSDGTVKLWNDLTGQQIGGFLSGPIEALSAVAFSPDGRIVACGSWDGTVMCGTPTPASPSADHTGHTEGVSALAFSPDGHILASASYDTTVRLWNPTPADRGQS